MCGDGLAQAVKGLEIPTDLIDLDQALWHFDRLQAKISNAVARTAAAGLWDEVGATSMKAWLKDRAGFTNAQAHRTVVNAQKLARLPVTREAWLDGDLTGGQVEVILAVVKEKYVGAFSDQEAELVPHLAVCSVAETEQAMGYWRAHRDALADGPLPREPHRELYLSGLLDGRGLLSGSLDPDTHQLVGTALDAATQLDTPAEVAGGAARSGPTRRADALAVICRAFLDHREAPTGSAATRHVPHVSFIVDGDPDARGPAAHYVNGTEVSKEWLKAMMCDSWVRSVFMAGTTRILDYGTETRLCPSDLWHGLVARDEHCRFPGCDRPPSWCAAHHVVWHSHGGATRADNLVLLCTRHHTVIHRKGWTAHLDQAANLTVTGPSRYTATSRPARSTVPRPGRHPLETIGS